MPLRGLTVRTQGRPRIRFLLPTLLFLLGLANACAASIDVDEAVHVLKAEGTVDPVMERYIDRGVDEAERTDARAVILRIDTPGGLDSAMRGIVQRIQSSKVPVITYVSPSGGRAASAGTFIVMAGHVAAMAPSTTIGAAHPINSDGSDIEGTLGRKVENDAAAYIRSIAEERGRNADWAERAVRNSVAIDSDEAVELGVVDFEASTVDDVIEQADGMRVDVAGAPVTLELVDAPVVENNPTFAEQVLKLISDPNIAFLLLSLGALGLLIEMAAPGHILPGVAGVIALILAFFALGTLPVNWAGVALIVLAFVLFGAELFVPGFGVLALGGLVALIFGGLILTSSGDPEFQVNRWLIFGLSAFIALFFISMITAAARTKRSLPYVGEQAMVGRVAIARTNLDPDGLVFFQGARWKATADDGPVRSGERVQVTSVRGLKLTVRREAEGMVQGEGV
jgi:membrane-bound serine protease (ClpP class)